MASKEYPNDIKIEELLDEDRPDNQKEDGNSNSPEEDSDSDSESELDTNSEYEGRRGIDRKRLKDDRLGSNTEVTKTEDLFQVLQSVLVKEEEETNRVKFLEEKTWDFPEDPENWREEDLQEVWADAPKDMTKPGWDPVWADEDDWEILRDEVEDGRTPLIAPFYVPYRKPYPPIPDKSYHFDIRSPKSVVEELDRIEEFLRWVSYIFDDGSSYEGTVWDDLAHGKGVFVAENGLVRYEGEWLQNAMEGHGVVEVDIPDIEPVPGSKLEKKMRANGMMISRDFMTPEDKEWMEMDIEDSYHLAGQHRQIPFYESNEWMKQFGKKPEKGRYRYAGQWKQGKMHGCGVYEVNEKTVYGRFYFGELLDEDEGCDDNTSALHAGIAEVAAAKARMFINKPDGMVREERGPYGDPQHPYFYEEDDLWMAPGFINQFCEVPNYWKTYVNEVDQEREMWLNSFYKAPLRIPMPAELEHWWSKNHSEEFILINKEPEPDPDDPCKFVYTEDPLILHVPTGRLIDYMEDEEYGLRLFWHPDEIEDEIGSAEETNTEEEIDSEKPEFLPLGYDEFFGRGPVVKEPHIWLRLVTRVQNACMDFLDGIKKWTEEQEEAAEKRKEKYEEELELEEAQLQLEEAMEDLDAELREMEKEHDDDDDDDDEGIETGLLDGDTSKLNGQDEKTAFEKKDQQKKEKEEEQEGEGEDEDGEGEDEDEDEDDTASSSFDSAGDEKGKTRGVPPFSTSSLSFASSSFISSAPYKLQESFSFWKGKSKFKMDPPPVTADPHVNTVDSIHFPLGHCRRGILKVSGRKCMEVKTRKRTKLCPMSMSSSCSSVACNQDSTNSKFKFDGWRQAAPKRDMDSILSLQTPLYNFDLFRGYTVGCSDILSRWDR